MLLAGENMNLKEYLFLKRMTVTEFSEMMGYHRNHISGIISGRVIPSRGLAKSIERITNGEVTAKELLKMKDRE